MPSISEKTATLVTEKETLLTKEGADAYVAKVIKDAADCIKTLPTKAKVLEPGLVSIADVLAVAQKIAENQPETVIESKIKQIDDSIAMLEAEEAIKPIEPIKEIAK